MNEACREAYERGRRAGEACLGSLQSNANNYLRWARAEYPLSAGLDYVAECGRLDRERIDAVPDLTRFPELRGMRERLVAERQGFQDAGHSPEWTGWHFTWPWFVSRRLNTRCVGRAGPATACTAVYFAEGAEGPIAGTNRDVPYWAGSGDGAEPPDGIRRPWRLLAVSAGVHCDEEPDEIFPADAPAMLPPDCRQIADISAFLTRYREFWGPGNFIFIDEALDSVVIEKTNCRLGFRKPYKGASAVTACTYMTPEIRPFMLERQRYSLEARGWSEDAPDWVYWRGNDRRHERLMALVGAEAERGSTLGGVLDILLDHRALFPDRICLAGETDHPAMRAEEANWTMDTAATVLEGTARRTVARHSTEHVPVYDVDPCLTLGEDIALRQEWIEEARLHTG